MIITEKLYDGKIEVVFDSGENGEKHDYRIEGKRKTGVTTFIGIIDKSMMLIPWAVGMALDYVRDNMDVLKLDPTEVYSRAQEAHNAEKEKAGDLGTAIMAWIENYIKGLEPEMPTNENVLQGVLSFLQWKDEHKVKFLSTERLVYSKKHDYVGKMDLEIEIDGKRYCADIKSGNGLYPEVMLQLAGYMMADVEESKRKYEGRWAIRVSKETEEEYMARMEKKNASKIARGMKATEIQPYQVFEAVYLDKDPKQLKKDFKAFINFMEGYRWKQEAEKYFRAIKNGKEV